MTQLERGILGGFIFALAIGAYMVSSSLYTYSVAGPTDVFPNGRVSVVTNDPAAAVELSLSSSSSWGDIYDWTDVPLALDITISTPSKRRALAFAIVMEGDAALPHDDELSGSALPHGGRRQPQDVWVKYVPEAWFIIEAGFTGFGGAIPPPPDSSVLVGRVIRPRGNPAFRVDVIGPTHGDLFLPTSNGFEFYFPALVSQEELISISEGEELVLANGDAVEAEAAKLLMDTKWHAPVKMSSQVEMFGVRANDRVDAIPAPISIDGEDYLWRGKDDLEVRGVIERRSVVQERERAQFLAGALVGLSGGLLVWGFEVLLPVGISLIRNRWASGRSEDDPEDQ